MLEFIMTYWLEILFSAIIGALTYAVKRFYSMYQKERERQESIEHANLVQDLKNEISKGNSEIYAKLDGLEQKYQTINTKMTDLKVGVLNVQKSAFKRKCEELLDKDQITQKEFTRLQEDHEAYKKLGGNGHGDELYELVREKYKDGL